MYIIIVGCGRSGSRLANMLSEEGHNVVIIDRNKDAFQRLGPLFNGLSFEGSGSDLQLLEEAGIRKADGVAVMTDSDSSNAMVAQIAEKIYQIKWVVAKIYDPELADSLKDFRFDIVSPTILISKLVRDRFLKGILHSYNQDMEDRLEFIEIPSNDKVIGKKYGSLNIPGAFTVIAYRNHTGYLIPTPETIVKKGDSLLCIINRAQKKGFQDLLGPASIVEEDKG